MWCMTLSVSVWWPSPLHKYMQHRLPFTIQLTFSSSSSSSTTNDANRIEQSKADHSTNHHKAEHYYYCIYWIKKNSHILFFISLRFVSSRLVHSFIVGVLLSVLLFSLQSTIWEEWEGESERCEEWNTAHNRTSEMSSALETRENKR